MRAYFKLSRQEKRLFREALRTVYACKIGLMFSSFKSYSQRLQSTGKDQNHDPEELKRVRRALQRTNKLTFWRNKCIVSTFAGRKMLNKRDIYSEAFLGLRKNDLNASLNAHSWLVSNSIQIVPMEMEYTELHQF